MSGIEMQVSLTRAQRDAVSAIRHFRSQRKVGSVWLIGDRRLSRRVISDLERLRLVREDVISGRPVLRAVADPQGNSTTITVDSANLRS